MDQLGVHVVGFQGGHGEDAAVIHDDGVTFRVAVAGGVAGNAGVEFLVGIVPRHAAGNHVGVGPGPVQVHLVQADGGLTAVGHQAFFYDQLGPGGQFGGGHALRGIHAANLHHFHFGHAVFFHVHFRAGVQQAFAGAVALAVVLFHVAHPGVFAHEKAVDAVVLAVLAAAVVDAAARHDDHVAVLADVKVVVHRFFEARFA